MTRTTLSRLLPIPIYVADIGGTCRHIKRVISYMRPSDLAIFGGSIAAGPLFAYALEKGWPSFVSRGTMGRIYRLNAAIGFFGGFILAAERSSRMLPTPILYSMLTEAL